MTQQPILVTHQVNRYDGTTQEFTCPANHADIRRFLGYADKAKLDAGKRETIVQGWLIHQLDADWAKARAKAIGNRFMHRVYAVCPECGATVSAGRTAQHVKVHAR